MDQPTPPTRVLDYESAIHKPSLARRLMRVLGFLLILALGAGIGLLIAWAIVPVHYVAEVLVYIGPPGSGETLPMRARTLQIYADRFASPAMQGIARDRLMGIITVQEWNETAISVRLERGSEMIRISADNRQADVASRVAGMMGQTSTAALRVDGMRSSILFPAAPAGMLLPQRDPRLLGAGAILGGVLASLLFSRQLIRRRSAGMPPTGSPTPTSPPTPGFGR